MNYEEDRKLALEDRRAILDAIFQVLKWLLATLFLLNGAAAVATINMDDLPPLVRTVAGGTFVSGLMAALVAGMSALVALMAALTYVTQPLRITAKRKWAPFVSMGSIVLGGLGSISVVVMMGVSVDLFVSGTQRVIEANVAKVTTTADKAQANVTRPANR